MLELFIDKLPEADREAYKQAIAGAIVVKSREDAQKYLNENAFFKSEKDALISRTTESYAQKFKEEKLPSLLDEEYKKKNPPKDPKDQALADMQAELGRMKRDGLLKERKALAMEKLNELGLPSYLSDFAIDEDENIFSNKIEKLAGLKAWGDELQKKALSGAVGNQQTPLQGNSTSTTFTRAQLANPEGRKAMADAQAKGLEVRITE